MRLVPDISVPTDFLLIINVNNANFIKELEKKKYDCYTYNVQHLPDTIHLIYFHTHQSSIITMLLSKIQNFCIC